MTRIFLLSLILWSSACALEPAPESDEADEPAQDAESAVRGRRCVTLRPAQPATVGGVPHRCSQRCTLASGKAVLANCTRAQGTSGPRPGPHCDIVNNPSSCTPS
jgi:hypothetical protein